MEFIGKILADLIDFFSDQAMNAWQSIKYLDISFYQVVIDIFVVSVLFYWLIQWVRGTKAKQILTGLGLIGLLYVLSRTTNLIALEWLLRNFFTVVLIAIPIIFQEEIRRGLQKIGETRFFSSESGTTQDTIKEIVQCAFELANLKFGALIVFQKEVNLEEYETTGVELDAHVSLPLLISIFNPKSPLHDGAVMVKGNRLTHTSCILPQSAKRFDGKFGTRHKAALTLSEYTDAIVVVVSEERKTVSVAMDGELKENLTPAELTAFLKTHL